MKKEIRKRVLAARDSILPARRKTKSREIEERLFSLPQFTSARAVLFFASFRSEVETGPMIRRALASGKRVILPKVRDKELELFEIKNFDKDVSPGAWGIPEPRESAPVRLDQIDVIVVPGAAFDEHGNRLGYGAGFYDKLLSEFTKLTIAVAFEEQIVAKIPTDPHDVPVRKIVTEKRVITAADSRERSA
ncbi:MAG TPA: 5-formyltetrahydrofolate cyclo-ligase [Nitrospirota bacterium]|nr:5-formyltetrahydrofolate cyclo-ligase [Nitrospirota bacterium]